MNGLILWVIVQVAALRASFDEAQSRIGAVSSNLRGQWHKSMALQVQCLVDLL